MNHVDESLLHADLYQDLDDLADESAQAAKTEDPRSYLGRADLAGWMLFSLGGTFAARCYEPLAPPYHGMVCRPPLR